MSDQSQQSPAEPQATGAATTVAPPPPPPAGGPPPPPPPAPESHGGRMTLGIVLIVVGALLLTARVAAFSDWMRFWPFIIVVAGLVEAFAPGKSGWSVAKMFDGFVTIAIGCVFLAITFGYVGWNVWGRILMLWPVLLVSLGLQILARGLHATWLKAAGSLVIIIALAYAVGTAATGHEGSWLLSESTSGEPVSLSEPVGSVNDARLTIDGGVANLDVMAGDDLIAVEGTSPWGEPTIEVDRSGTSADVKTTFGRDETNVWPGQPTADLDVSLSDSVLWDVRMNVGVTDVTADLTDVPVRSLDLRPGVASCEVRLGEVPQGLAEARADVRSGVSSVTLHVPADADARVLVSSGLSGTNVRGGFQKTGTGTWETPGYQAARAAGGPVWVIDVRSGIGSIDIDTY